MNAEGREGPIPRGTGRRATVVVLGSSQTLAWASSYYLPAILAAPIAHDLGLAVPTVFLAFSAALLVSAALGPYAGRAIDRWGGRPVLMVTNLVFALGLVALGLAQGTASLFLAWAIIGVAMGSGLYEAAFAALVRLYGSGSRNAITGITLFAGFASTVGWPLSTVLEAQLGWRGTCFAWAALHLCVGLPLNALLPRPAAALVPEADASAATAPAGDHASASRRVAWLLATVFATAWFVTTAMAAHLPRMLQMGGASLAAAVAVGALVGPSQVAGRLLEFGAFRHLHPLVSARLAALMPPVGAALLAVLGAPAAIAFALLHGVGNGILTIAKGTLPLVLLGPAGYGERQGLLMIPARLAQASAPWLFGVCLDRWGSGALWLSVALGMTAFAALMLLRRGAPGAGPFLMPGGS